MPQLFKGKNQLKARGAAAGIAIIFFMFIGTVTFHSLEDWTWIQSFYFTVVTLATVGYGDLVPTNDGTRLFTAVFILMGVTIVVSAFSLVGNGVIERRMQKRQARINGKKD